VRNLLLLTKQFFKGQIMKLFFRQTSWLITLFSVILATNTLFAGDVTSQKGLLWQIDKPGLTPSYLLGTIHSEDSRIRQVLSAVHSYFRQADTITVEMQMDVPTIMKLTKAMFFVRGQSLDKVLDRSLYAKVVTAFKKYSIPPRITKTFKPWAVIATLSTPIPKTGEFMDLLLYKEAKKLQKPIYGLEKVEEQLAVFEGLSFDDQIILLKETLKDVDKMLGIFDILHNLYFQRDLSALMTFSEKYTQENSSIENQAMVKAFYKRIVDDRNINMAKGMEQRLQEGNAFIAIGALHLPGKRGVLKLLQQRGYRVSAVY
jgi:uncharacterized protein YbaP (TraB family)